MTAALEYAVPAGVDPRDHARVLARIRDATLTGARAPARPRPVIGDSWRRVLNQGVDPDRGGSAALLDTAEVEHRRARSGLLDVLDILRGALVPAAEDAGHVMVVVDPDGVVLWREGAAAVQRRANNLGFTTGARWSEAAVGTNAIGTALVARRPVQVYAAEHFVRSHHAWTCAAAPLHDPRDGALLAVIDVSGPAATVHPSTLGLVAVAGRLAESALRISHHAELDRLRATAVPLLARTPGTAVVTDRHGWVAAANGVAPIDRLMLPADLTDDHAWLPALGSCVLEPLPGGWLVRPTGDTEETSATRVRLDLSSPRTARLHVTSASGSWRHALSPRHAEVLLVLALHPAGRSAAELSGDLFGTPDRMVTVRAEMSRLRRHLGGVLLHRPYRFADWIDVEIVPPADPAQLLGCSTAPAIRRYRQGLER